MGSLFGVYVGVYSSLFIGSIFGFTIWQAVDVLCQSVDIALPYATDIRSLFVLGTQTWYIFWVKKATCCFSYNRSTNVLLWEVVVIIFVMRRSLHFPCLELLTMMAWSGLVGVGVSGSRGLEWVGGGCRGWEWFGVGWFVRN